VKVFLRLLILSILVPAYLHSTNSTMGGIASTIKAGISILNDLRMLW
jgi:hypothetical protein